MSLPDGLFVGKDPVKGLHTLLPDIGRQGLVGVEVERYLAPGGADHKVVMQPVVGFGFILRRLAFKIRQVSFLYPVDLPGKSLVLFRVFLPVNKFCYISHGLMFFWLSTQKNRPGMLAGPCAGRTQAPPFPYIVPKKFLLTCLTYMKTMKKTILLLALPCWLMAACSQDKRPESGQTEPITTEAEGGDPAVRAQEYEHGTENDVADTIPPVNPDTVQKTR
jgi:hypothetical protein